MSSPKSIPIYLDYNATTNIHEKVQKTMQPYISNYFGNPSSSHIYGIETKKAISYAREQIKNMLNCDSPEEIIFTSGGSESNNYATKGVVFNYIHHNSINNNKINIICSSIEHPSIKEIFEYLADIFKDRLSVSYIPVNNEGIVDIKEFCKLMNENTIFVSVMLANNETGVIQPIKELVEICKKINKNCIFHSDAAQAIGKIPVNVKELNVDLLSIAGHKFYAPKGIGALYIKSGIEKKLEKIIHGASHEYNMRAGTENVLEIVGLGKAGELVQEEIMDRCRQYMYTRNIIYEHIIKELPSSVLHGPKISLSKNPLYLSDPELLYLLKLEKRLTNTLYISFPGIEANVILNMLEEKVAFSAGAACHSEGVHMSYVLENMKVPPEIAMGTVRISTGLGTSEEDALSAAKNIVSVVKSLSKDKDIEFSTTTDKDFCKLSKAASGMGCGCKISPKILNEILGSLKKQKCADNPKILVSNDSCDDACVYDLSQETKNDEALISTVDFFTPICDNPYNYGAISCANALSDIYAMGGKPLNALSIVAFPTTLFPLNILKEILRGALEKADEAMCPILGGHSIIDSEPKFGLSVNGICKKDRIWKNNEVKQGDIILITKKIGVGVLMGAVKKGMLTEKDDAIKEAVESMKYLNKYHAEILIQYEHDNKRIVNACTDITGFGIIGHLYECLNKTGLKGIINYKNICFISRSKEMIQNGIELGAAKSNMNYTKNYIEYGSLSDSEKILINDPQTSGGLMFFINKDNIEIVRELFKKNNLQFYEIGNVEKCNKDEKMIEIIKN